MTEPIYAAELRALEAGGINLDVYSIDADDVWRMAECLTRQSRYAGRIMFPDRPKGYVRATEKLGHYAYNKATAMRHRLAGKIAIAQDYEIICQYIYDRLPAFARW